MNAEKTEPDVGVTGDKTEFTDIWSAFLLFQAINY